MAELCGWIRRLPDRASLFALIPVLLLSASNPADAARRSAPPVETVATLDRFARIVVNSNSSAPSIPGRITLLSAIATAARSTQPTTIEFDAQAFGASTTIRLTKALAIEESSSPIRIDASATQVAVTIDASACPDAGISIAGETRVTIIGVTIRGGAQRVILCKDRAQLTLKDVTVSDGAMPGIAAFGQAGLTISSSRLVNNHTHGLELHDQCTARLERVDSSRNGQSGLAGFDAADIQATRCRIEENTEWGVVLTDSSKCELTSTIVRKNRFSNADVSSSATFTAIECELLEGQRFGIFATGRAAIKVTKSRIAANGSRGIEAQDRTSIELEASKIEKSADYGLILFGQTQVVASDCLFINNAAHGVSLRGTASGKFTKCTFAGNRYSGLGCLDGHDGGSVFVSQCLFRQNGMRPIYRGPLHLDPLVPTPLRVIGSKVECLADPNALIELYVDRAGEASRYLGSIPADGQGRFEIDTKQVPDGYALTASATAGNATSEFNVIAGSRSAPILDALLGRTGPLSDESGEINLDTMLRRWRGNTKLVFQMDKAPSVAVERYVRFLVDRVPGWTDGVMKPQLAIGGGSSRPRDAVVIPIHYLGADAEQLANRGGVTYMRWDASGFFVPPMEIMLALGREAQDTCPRVLAHEMGHALGLCHVRVGLLSRMQGSAAPAASYVNDFSPMMTYYDVLALQALHSTRDAGGTTLRDLVQRGLIPDATTPQVAQAKSAMLEPNFSPPPGADPISAGPSGTPRP